MNAGESARLEARRSRERAEWLARRAAMFEKGAEGESRTAAALAALGPHWVTFHDHRWPGRRLANVDHVVVGPAGIFVIDSKNWSGDVRVEDGVLRQNGRSREKAVASAADAALAVAELAPAYAGMVRPVLCFVGDEDHCGWVRDVMVCSTTNVVRMLTTRPPVLVPMRVREVATRLDMQLRSATDPLPRRPVVQTSVPSGEPTRTATSVPRPRRRAGAGLGRFAVGMALAAGLVFAGPTVLPPIADAFANFFVSQVEPAPEECASKEPSKPARRDEQRRDRADRNGGVCR